MHVLESLIKTWLNKYLFAHSLYLVCDAFHREKNTLNQNLQIKEDKHKPAFTSFTALKVLE